MPDLIYYMQVVIPENNYVNPRIIEKLAVRPPSAEAIIQYLTKIAEEFNVDWHVPIACSMFMCFLFLHEALQDSH